MLTNINVLSPVLALGIKLGCGTNDSTQYVSHLIVYWVSMMMMTMMMMWMMVMLVVMVMVMGMVMVIMMMITSFATVSA